MTNWNTRWGWKKVVAHLGFFAGAQAKAGELGYELEHFWLHEPGLTQGRLSRMLYARGINGLIIASHSRQMGDNLEFDWDRFSAVKIDYFPHRPMLHNVTNNQSSVIRLAMRKVIEAGYRRIGFVMHRGWNHAVDHNWTAGFPANRRIWRALTGYRPIYSRSRFPSSAGSTRPMHQCRWMSGRSHVGWRNTGPRC